MVVVILLLADESVSVNRDGDSGWGTGLFGLGFCRRMFSSVTSSTVSPESCKCLLILQVRSGVRAEGCRDRVGSSRVVKLSVSKKKKWKGAWLGNQH